MFNIHLIMVHIPGKCNAIADLLSRWLIVANPQDKLQKILSEFIWVNMHINLTALNYNI